MTATKLEFRQLSQKVRFKERKFKFTQNQVEFLKTALDPDVKLLFLAGPAGTAKTYMATYAALQMLMNSNLEKEILYVRSIAESSEKSIGALPGDLGEKFGAFAGPFYDKLEELLSPSDIKLLKEKSLINCMPVNFLRGASWSDKIIIIDEAQNFSRKELITTLTRIGEDSKIFILGDILQSDIQNGGFVEIYDLFNNSQSEEKGVNCYSFGNEDIMRSDILRYIVAKLEEQENESRRI